MGLLVHEWGTYGSRQTTGSTTDVECIVLWQFLCLLLVQGGHTDPISFQSLSKANVGFSLASNAPGLTREIGILDEDLGARQGVARDLVTMYEDVDKARADRSVVELKTDRQGRMARYNAEVEMRDASLRCGLSGAKRCCCVPVGG